MSFLKNWIANFQDFYWKFNPFLYWIAFARFGEIHHLLHGHLSPDFGAYSSVFLLINHGCDDCSFVSVQIRWSAHTLRDWSHLQSSEISAWSRTQSVLILRVQLRRMFLMLSSVCHKCQYVKFVNSIADIFYIYRIYSIICLFYHLLRVWYWNLWLCLQIWLAVLASLYVWASCSVKLQY